MRTSSFRYELPSNAVDVIEPLVGNRRRGNSDHSSSTGKRVISDTVDFGTTSRHSRRYGSNISLQSSLSYVSQAEPIDNTLLLYVPITLPCGNVVMCAPDVLTNCPMVLRSLQADLTQILRILPWSVHALVQRTKIWVNVSYSYGTREEPFVLRHSTAHHSEGWLVDCARDRPDKAHGIEIYSCLDFERMRLHWNGCGLLLHEFTHLIHQFCLGLDCPQVEQLYRRANESGRYERTLRRDWAGKDEDSDLAYAMVDQKEFFAEMSVTFLSDGYHDLDDEDSTQMELCSPPLLEPLTMNRVLQLYGIRDEPYAKDTDDDCSFWMSLFEKHRNLIRGKQARLRMAHPLWQEATVSRGCRDAVHCNKFYPFTKGQLRNHDREVFQGMKDLWHEIAMYDDPMDERTNCRSLRKLLPGWGS